MSMHEEYLAQVKFAFAPTRWANAIWHTSPAAKRYAGTLEEAQNAIRPLRAATRTTRSRKSLKAASVSGWSRTGKKSRRREQCSTLPTTRGCGTLMRS